MIFPKEFQRGVMLGKALASPHKNCEAYQKMIAESEALQIKMNQVLIEHDSGCPCSTGASHSAALELTTFIEKAKTHA